jgi:hypothetical protein
MDAEDFGVSSENTKPDTGRSASDGSGNPKRSPGVMLFYASLHSLRQLGRLPYRSARVLLTLVEFDPRNPTHSNPFGG